MNQIDDYCMELEILGCKPSYLRAIGSSCSVFSATKGCEAENLDPPDVTEGDVKTWIQDMRHRKLSDEGIKNRVGHLTRFFDFLIESLDHDCITINPFTRIFKRLPTNRKQTRRPFKTVEAVGRMIKSAFNPRDRAILAILAKLGLRRGGSHGAESWGY